MWQEWGVNAQCESFQIERFHTSTAYRYSYPNWSEEKNLQTFGEDHSLDGVAYNLVVDVKVPSVLMQEANLRIKLKNTIAQIDHKYLNHDLPELGLESVSLEKIAMFLRGKLQEQFDNQEICVRVFEGPYRNIEVNNEGIILSQSCKINCVHRHWKPELNEKENLKLYGKCSGIHGHEYKIDICLIGDVDKDTGLIINRKSFNEVLQKQIVRPLHGTFLNDHLGNTSGEKIALYVYKKLKEHFQVPKLYRVSVHETRKNSFYVGAQPF